MVAISGTASRRHFFRAGRPLLLALVVAASGCASSLQTHEEKVKDAGNAATQLSLFCGPYFLGCAISSALVVAGVGKLTEPPSDREPKRPQHEGAKFVTWLPRSDFSPSGSLLIDEASVENYGSHVVYGPLVVNIDEPLGDSTRSIQEDIAVHCATGEVEFSWRVSYDQPNAKGKIVTSRPASTAIAPGPELDAVKHEFCKFDSKG